MIARALLELAELTDPELRLLAVLVQTETELREYRAAVRAHAERVAQERAEQRTQGTKRRRRARKDQTP